MANDLNQCNFIGRLGADPEVFETSGGGVITSFRIAVGWKSKDKEGTEWVGIKTFGRLAEICEEYLEKGSKVMVSGRFVTEEYEKDGVKRYSSKIIADRMQMLDGRKDEGQAPPAHAPATPQRHGDRPGARPAAKQTGTGFDDLDEDCPF